MNVKSLSLYHFESCPFCSITRKAIRKNNLNVELRDIQLDTEYLDDLIIHGGKAQVPCLLIERHKARSEWLYESSEIIQFLNNTAGQQKQVA